MGLLDSLIRTFTGHDDFKRICQDIGDTLGLHFVPDDDDNNGAWAVPYAGATYTVIVHRQHDKVLLSVLSNVRFPRGRLPVEIARVLSDRNRKLPHCDWDAVDGRNNAYFYLKAQAQLAAFDAGLVQSALREMVPEVAALDQTLEQGGYVR